MSETVKLGANARIALIDGITSRVGASSKLAVYTGTAPADSDSAATGTKLSEHDLTGSTFAAASDDGTTATSTGTPPSASLGLATGTPGYARINDDAGDCVAQGDCGAQGAGTVFVEVNPLSIESGGTVTVTSLNIFYANA